MGIVYSVGCKQCKIYRDLDKMCGLHPIADYNPLEEMIAELPDNGKRSAVLLASFMHEHEGHDCILFSDLAIVPEEDYGFTQEKGAFWSC